MVALKKNVADVINFLDGSMEVEVLDKIKNWDEELSNLMNKMFVFENITDMDDRSIQTLLRDVTTEQLKIALKGTTETTKEKIFTNMSKRVSTISCGMILRFKDR